MFLKFNYSFISYDILSCSVKKEILGLPLMGAIGAFQFGGV